MGAWSQYLPVMKGDLQTLYNLYWTQFQGTHKNSAKSKQNLELLGLMTGLVLVMKSYDEIHHKISSQGPDQSFFLLLLF